MIEDMGASAAVVDIGVVWTINFLAYAINQTITQRMLPIVAYCYSSGHIQRMKSVVGFSVMLTVIFSLLCIAVDIYPLLFVIISVFQAVGEGAKFFLLSLLHKGSLDIVLFFVIRKVFGLEEILWATPTLAAVALIVGIILVLWLFKTIHLKQ